MKPKEFIEIAISQAEKKAFPHLVSDNQALLEYMEIVKYCSKILKEALVQPKLIKTIKAGDLEYKYLDLSEYKTLIKNDFNKTTFLVEKMQDQQFKKNKKQHSEEEIFQILKFQHTVLDIFMSFQKEIVKTLDDFNDVLYEDLLEEGESSDIELLDEDTPFYERYILPTKDIKNWKDYEKLTNDSFLLISGQPTVANLEMWIDRLSKNITRSMNNVGLKATPENVTLHGQIAYYMHNGSDENWGTFYHNTNNKYKNEKNNNFKKITFRHDLPETTHTIMHEWSHALDFELGIKLMKKNIMASHIFSNMESSYDENFMKLGKEIFSKIANNSDSKTYQEKLNQEVEKYEKFATQIIGETLFYPDIHWNQLSPQQQKSITKQPQFQTAIKLALEGLTQKSPKFNKYFGVLIKSLMNSDDYLEINKNVKKHNLIEHTKRIKFLVKKYSVENKIFIVNDGTPSSPSKYTLANTDFMYSAHLTSFIEQSIYMSSSHEVFARSMQAMSHDTPIYNKVPENVENPKKQAIEEKKQILQNFSRKPEVDCDLKLLQYKFVQEAAKFLNLSLEIEKLPQISTKDLNSHIKMKTRGLLIDNTQYIPQSIRIFEDFVKKAEDAIIESNKKAKLTSKSNTLKL